MSGTNAGIGLVALGLVTFVACGDGSTPATTPVDAGSDTPDSGLDTDVFTPECEVRFPTAEPFQTLAEYCFFGGDPVAHRPNTAVIPYDVNATLYADESLKMRFLVIPQGESIGYSDDERWSFPEGAVTIKTFYYENDVRDPSQGRQLLETRLLVREGEVGWTQYIYVWNKEQTEARLDLLGSWKDVRYVDAEGEARELRYKVPDKNQCKNCHGQDDVVYHLGPSTRQLNRDYVYTDGTRNQVDHLRELGLFDVDPAPADTLFALADPLGDESAERKARSYLDANCSHCHNPEGAGGPSGLNLSIFVEDPREYGVCRRPVAAGEGSGGRLFDIAPGEPDASIMVFRMSSTDPELKMPELPTQTSDQVGVNLIRDWIQSMDDITCE